jgi:hypothetical protein
MTSAASHSRTAVPPRPVLRERDGVRVLPLILYGLFILFLLMAPTNGGSRPAGSSS